MGDEQDGAPPPGPDPGDADRAEGQIPPDVGSIGEEAAKLLGALADWSRGQGADAGAGLAQGLAQGVSGLAGQAAHAMNDVNEHLATGSAECTYCPVCRTVHAVRQTSPEVRAHLASAASSFLQAMAGMLATLPPPQGAAPAGRTEFERIDLEDDQ